MVRVLTRSLRLPLRPQPALAEADAQAEAARRRRQDLVDRRVPAAEIEAATFAAKRAAMTRERARSFGGRSELPVELHLLQIGPAVFAGIPCEPFAEIGRASCRERV